MDFSKCNIGLGITGSFCMFSRARKEIERLTALGANVIPIFSFIKGNSFSTWVGGLHSILFFEY